jgi:mannose-1-phosphate guanylyltransferase
MGTAQIKQPLALAQSIYDPGWKSRWAIVLAGGDDTRLNTPLDQHANGHKPKQYCSLVGDRTMLQQTHDRAVSMVVPEQVVTVIGRNHRRFLAETSKRPVPGAIIEQPINLGTAPGILLPTAFVSEIDPEATILILPADQFVHPEKLFLRHVAQAFQCADACPHQLILVGVPADRPETGYGWILAEKHRTSVQACATSAPLLRVAHFREKPDFDEARSLLHLNGLWSTMVIAIKAKTLWALARKCLPEMMDYFDAFRQIIRAVREGEVAPSWEAFALEDLYKSLQPADFSKDILQCIVPEILVMPMTGVTWYDWSHPQHVTESLASLNRKPV